VKIIQGYGAPELGIFPRARAGAQIKNQEQELSLRARGMVIDHLRGSSGFLPRY